MRHKLILNNFFFNYSINKLSYTQETFTAQTSTTNKMQNVQHLPIDKSKTKSEQISRAMKAFLERSSESAKMMSEKETEFEIGKRHLAKIMGIDDDDTFDQNQIDKAIRYLLPSGIFEKTAQPFMKHPSAIYPKSRESAFSTNGRPFHYLFYTTNPKYYELIDTICAKINELDKLEDALFDMQQKNKLTINELEKINIKNFKWIGINDITRKIGEIIDMSQYTRFVRCLNRLAKHKLAKNEENFIRSMQNEIVVASKLHETKPLLEDENGVQYQIKEGIQRLGHVEVKLKKGNGEIVIKSKTEGEFDITYFYEIKHREQILFPFKVVDGINKYDLEMRVNDGGMSLLAKAARFAIANALTSFVTAEQIEKLRLSGLLTQDKRVKERKKFGQEGARRKFTWKKR